MARKIKVAPSTINRFLNDPNYPNLLSGKTLAKIAALSGVPVPEQVARVIAPIPVDTESDKATTIDPDILAEAICRVRAWLAKRPSPPTPQSEAEMIAFVYDYILDSDGKSE